MGTELTKEEIDAMESLMNEADKTSWEVCESLEVLRLARQFIPKAIAEIRRNAVEYRAHVQRIRELEEQTRWRHIDQEQPEGIEFVLVSVHNSFIIAQYAKTDGRWFENSGGAFYSSQSFPHWQPLPTKGPE